MWGINLQLGGRRFGFIFKGLSGVSGERVLTGQKSLGCGLGSLLSQVPKKGPGAPDYRHTAHPPGSSVPVSSRAISARYAADSCNAMHLYLLMSHSHSRPNPRRIACTSCWRSCAVRSCLTFLENPAQMPFKSNSDRSAGPMVMDAHSRAICSRNACSPGRHRRHLIVRSPPLSLVTYSCLPR